MSKVIEEQEARRINKFQWFLFVVLIPLLFAIVLALIVFTVAGINVFDATKEYGQKVPLVSSLFKKENVESADELKKHIISLEAEIKDKEANIYQLETQIDGKDKEVERVKLEKEQLQAQIDQLTAMQEENKRAFKDIVKTYETMSAKKAAPIITQMSDQEAVSILTNVKPDTLAAIMENLDTVKAAKYTELLTNENENIKDQQ